MLLPRQVSVISAKKFSSPEKPVLLTESRDQQLKAQAALQRALGDGFIVALNLAPTTPDWLVRGAAQPMKLGLDLSGGVHFKLEVDVDAATSRKLEQYENGIKRRLREERIRGRVALDGTRVGMTFRSVEDREEARSQVRDLYRSYCSIALTKMVRSCLLR